MKTVSAFLRIAPSIAGGTLLFIGWRLAAFPYEDGRVFDVETGTVHHVQTAEVCLVVGGTLLLLGFVLGFDSYLRYHARILSAQS